MTCKNCKKELVSSANYCNFCGAEVVTTRISKKEIFSQFSTKLFGWDNSFFRTLKYLLIKPNIILSEYLDGTRKKYTNPFSFLAFCTSISLIVFNMFSTQYLELSSFGSNSQLAIEAPNEPATSDTAQAIIQTEINTTEGQSEKAEVSDINNSLQEFFLKYHLFFSFLFLPFYGYISEIVFGKQFNAGVTINAFIQGFLVFSTLLLFVASLILDPKIYYISFALILVYYPYAYSKLCKLSLFQAFLKILKFLFLLIGIFIATAGSGYLLGRYTNI